MEGLLSLLLFAGLFYVLMRFGCGAHMVHGHGGHAEHGRETPAPTTEGASALDPVCGMPVAADQGYTRVHEGRRYRFCSRVCLDKFEAQSAELRRRRCAMTRGLSLVAVGHATACFWPSRSRCVSRSTSCFPLTRCTRRGRTCSQDSGGSVGAAISSGLSKATATAGMWR